MDSMRDTACAVGCPIRRSRDQRALASPPGFSQRATSFIASRCQGIHQMPLPQRLIAKTHRLQRQAPQANRPSREETHSEETRSQNVEARNRLLAQHPNSLGIHRSIRHPSATTADGLTPPRLTPSSPVKDQTPTSSHPWANLLFPIDDPS